MSIKTALNEEILNQIENLGKEAIGSDEYKANADVVTKLLDRKIEIDKLESERNIEIEKMLNENENKERQINEDKKDRRWKYGVAIGTFVGSSIMYGLAFIASTNFEREGTFTTKGGMNSIKNLLSIKQQS